MTDTENIENRLDVIVASLDDIRQAINNISMPDFDVEATEHALFPDFTQDVSMYRDFDWETIGAKVVKTDQHGATAILYKGNVFKRGADLNPKNVSIYYTKNGFPQSEGLIRFKDMELEDIKPFENTIGQGNVPAAPDFDDLLFDSTPSQRKYQKMRREYKTKLQETKVLAEVFGDFEQAAQYCRAAIELVNSLVEASEEIYDLNLAAQLKYGNLPRLEERLKEFQERAKTST